MLAAANCTPIATYGQKSLTLDLGLQFRWIFTVADVSKPIIGADFLTYFGLLVDLKRKRLIDPLTQSNLDCIAQPFPEYNRITSLQPSTSPYMAVLNQFPDITNPIFRDRR